MTKSAELRAIRENFLKGALARAKMRARITPKVVGDLVEDDLPNIPVVLDEKDEAEIAALDAEIAAAEATEAKEAEATKKDTKPTKKLPGTLTGSFRATSKVTVVAPTAAHGRRDAVGLPTTRGDSSVRVIRALLAGRGKGPAPAPLTGRRSATHRRGYDRARRADQVGVRRPAAVRKGAPSMAAAPAPK